MAQYITLHYTVSLCAAHCCSAQQKIKKYSLQQPSLCNNCLQPYHLNVCGASTSLVMLWNHGPCGKFIEDLRCEHSRVFRAAAVSVVCCVSPSFLSRIELPVLVQQESAVMVSLHAPIQHAIKGLHSVEGV